MPASSFFPASRSWNQLSLPFGLVKLSHLKPLPVDLSITTNLPMLFVIGGGDVEGGDVEERGYTRLLPSRYKRESLDPRKLRAANIPIFRASTT